MDRPALRFPFPDCLPLPRGPCGYRATNQLGFPYLFHVNNDVFYFVNINGGFSSVRPFGRKVPKSDEWEAHRRGYYPSLSASLVGFVLNDRFQVSKEHFQGVGVRATGRVAETAGRWWRVESWDGQLSGHGRVLRPRRTKDVWWLSRPAAKALLTAIGT